MSRTSKVIVFTEITYSYESRIVWGKHYTLQILEYNQMISVNWLTHQPDTGVRGRSIVTWAGLNDV